MEPVGKGTPHHVAIIMDGNGRWAQARGLQRSAGHQAGLEAVRRAVTACGELGIPVLTLYTFSTENWSRPAAEVGFLMQLVQHALAREFAQLWREGVRLQLMGSREGLPAPLLRAPDNASSLTAGNTRLILNLALNYGGRAEIVEAARAIIAAHRQGGLDLADLDEAAFARYLYLPGLPDADLIIRTAGEQRLSIFMLWRAVGAVFWSTPVLWPDFGQSHLLEAIRAYREQSADGRDAWLDLP